jgi:hypothetical protein
MKFDDVLQWAGCLFLVGGHTLNAVGPVAYPWNIVAFTLGTLMFLIWSVRQRNAPQMTVNVVSITLCGVGLLQAVRS